MSIEDFISIIESKKIGILNNVNVQNLNFIEYQMNSFIKINHK